MGGSPWQSTGCLTCRKRKIKCDKQEPECERCIKRGIQCPGYDKFRIFFYQETASTKREKPKNWSESPSTQLQDRDREKQSETSNNNDPATTRTYSNRARQLTSRHNALNSGPTKREQIFASYMNVYFPNDINGTTELDPWYGLISGISSLPNKPPMLERALAAQSCIIVGRQYDEGMFYHGLQLYNTAIQHMSRVIKRNGYSDDVVYTAAIFHGLVSSHCPFGLDVWINQVSVTSGILKHYSHYASDNPLVKSLYLGIHRMRLLQSLSPLQSNTETDMAEDKVPPSSMEMEHLFHPVDELLELMGEIAPLAAIINPKGSKYCAHYEQETLFSCLAQREKLSSWYTRRQEDIGSGPIPCSSSELITKLPNADHLFGKPYWFTSLDNARIHVLFWAALCLLETLIGQAQLRPAAGEYLLAEFYADEISRALPFCLQEKMKAWGGHISMFGCCQISKLYLDLGRKDKFFWSQHAFQVQAGMGSDFSLHVGNMLSYSWGMKEKEDFVQSSSPLGEDTDGSPW